MKFSLTVETTVFNSQQPLPLCLLLYIIHSLLFNRLTAYRISRDCLQCSLTLSVTCSHCEAL